MAMMVGWYLPEPRQVVVRGQHPFSKAPVHCDATEIAAGEPGQGMRRAQVTGFDLHVRGNFTGETTVAKGLNGNPYDKCDIGYLGSCL